MTAYYYGDPKQHLTEARCSRCGHYACPQEFGLQGKDYDCTHRCDTCTSSEVWEDEGGA